MIIKGKPANPMSAFNAQVKYSQFEYLTVESASFLLGDKLNMIANERVDGATPWKLIDFKIDQGNFYYIFERSHTVIDYERQEP